MGAYPGQGACTHIVAGRVIFSPCLDAISQEAEDRPNPQQDGETSKQLSAELDPFWCGGWWCEGVRTVSGQNLLGFTVCQTLKDAGFIKEPAPRSTRDTSLKSSSLSPGPAHPQPVLRPSSARAPPILTCTQSVLYFRQTSSTDILCSV